MNMPNKLTISRIVLAFVFMWLLFCRGVQCKVLALVVFVAASLTDILDGYLAKRYRMVTDFGKFMDPIADKVLIIAAFLSFVEMRLIPAWTAVFVVLRELIVTGLRIFALAKGKVISADAGGKQKMVSQVVTIFFTIIFIVLREAGAQALPFWSPQVESAYRETIFFLMLVTVVFTIISGVSHLIRNRELYFNVKVR